jgi:RNA polymerase sigma factor (sigma-70 family)
MLVTIDNNSVTHMPTLNCKLHAVHNNELHTNTKTVLSKTQRPESATINIADSKSVYLRAAKNVDLLSRDDEIKLAQQIEQGERIILNALLRSRLTVNKFIYLGKCLALDRIKLSEILRNGDNDDKLTKNSLIHLFGKLPELQSKRECVPSVDVQAVNNEIFKLFANIRLHRKQLNIHITNFLQQIENDERIIRDVLGMDINCAREVCAEIKRGQHTAEQARIKFIQANLRLVIYIANKCKKDIDIIDLIQEGNIGLIKAVDKFDYRCGNRFSTYSFHWICNEISKAIDEQTRMIHIPIGVLRMRKKAIYTYQMTTRESGSNPTVEEFATKINIPVKKTKELLEIDNTVDLKTSANLNDDYQDVCLGPWDILVKNRLNTLVHELLKTLTEREQEVLRLRFGMEECTLEEIGQRFSVTRERARQIEAKALNKLRKSEKIRLFLE